MKINRKDIVPLLISLLLSLITISVVLTTDYVINTKHYIGFSALVISTFLFFKNKEIYGYVFAITLVAGLIGFLDFFYATFKIGFGIVQVNPGAKLQKNVLKQGETNPKTTEYAGNYIYENDKLQFFGQAEGYVEPKNVDNLALGYNYIYQYTDHLGIVRLSYKNVGTSTVDLEIQEENNYYPFGMKHKGYNNVQSASRDHKFEYNGVEFEESLGLNLMEMEVRSYDPAIGRFTTIDPITHHSFSPYAAFDNNPVFWADPSGANSVQDLIDEAWSNPGIKFSSNGDGTFSGSDVTIGSKENQDQKSNRS